MKKIIKTLLTALTIIALASGCRKESDRMLEELTGDWHYTAEESGVTEDVWVAFSADCTFEIYQKIGDGAWWHSTGEFILDPQTKTLSGIYSDRYPWKYSYNIAVSSSALTMTAVETEGYTVTYTREAIPDEVRAKALPLTKDGMAETPRFL